MYKRQVAYQYVDGSETTSYVAFYNFGDVGQSEDDRIVSGYTYEGTVIPQIMYLNGGKSLAVRDDGFTLYKGSQIPKEKETVKVDKEIVSTFYDDDIIAVSYTHLDVYKRQELQTIIEQKLGKSIELHMLVAEDHQQTNLTQITVDQAIRENIHMDVVIEETPGSEPEE